MVLEVQLSARAKENLGLRPGSLSRRQMQGKAARLAVQAKQVAAQTQPRLLELQSSQARQPSRRGIRSSQARRTPARRLHHWQAPRQQPHDARSSQAQPRSLEVQVSRHQWEQVQQVRLRQQGQLNQLLLDPSRLQLRSRTRTATEARRQRMRNLLHQSMA